MIASVLRVANVRVTSSDVLERVCKGTQSHIVLNIPS
jgi:hypothetical protein